MFMRKKNDEFSFSAKLMPNLVCLTNVFVAFFLSKVQMPESRTTNLNLIQLSLS